MANTKTYTSNAAESTLSAALGVGATTVNVVSTTGFPAVPFYAVLEPATDAKREVILATAKTATTLTATRAQDGTADVAHDSGATIKIVPVAAHINDLHDRVDAVSTVASAAYAPGGTDVPITDGGTGASTAANARTNLGLGNVDNTSDANKPVSTAQQTALDAKVDLAGDTMSGELNFADQLATRPILKDYGEEVATDASSGAAHTIDLTTGNVHDVTLTANCTFTFSNPTASGDACSFTLILRQDGTGSRAVTWPASVDWPGGVAPTLSTAASAVDILTFVTVDGGTRWFGNVVGLAYA